MAHWFDRMSRAAAGDVDVSRRSLFVGAGVAAFATTPLARDSMAHAAIQIEGRAAQTACESCLNDEIKDHKKNLKNCDKTGNVFGVIVKGKGKGKKAKKAPPVPAAKKLACILGEESTHAFWMKDCAQFKCRAPGFKQPPTEINGQPTGWGPNDCAPGTTLCSKSEQLCCFNGDACCACGSGGRGGWICCAGVIGCTCC